MQTAWRKDKEQQRRLEVKWNDGKGERRANVFVLLMQVK